MGSFSLKEVFRTSGMPVRRRKDSIRFQKRGLTLRETDWTRPVLSIEHHQHKRRGIRVFKVFLDIFLQHGRSKRPETLPVLDAQVQEVLHLRLARVRKDAPVPQSSGTKLHSPLKPAYNLSRGYQFCGALFHVVSPLI